MSKWGIEEKETLEKINQINFKGTILNLAAGDGRFNNSLLRVADKVVAMDKNDNDLKELEKICPSYLKNKLEIKMSDITKPFPFCTNSLDGVFCTGTLHLFDVKTINFILSEIERIIKPKGKIVFDFATDILRLDTHNQPVVFNGEGSYTLEEGINIFQNQLKNFHLTFEKSEFQEENVDKSVGYQQIKGNFLIISGEYIPKEEGII